MAKMAQREVGAWGSGAMNRCVGGGPGCQADAQWLACECPARAVLFVCPETSLGPTHPPPPPLHPPKYIILCLEDTSDWNNATTRRIVMQVGAALRPATHRPSPCR
jgi:hypothetical protein